MIKRTIILCAVLLTCLHVQGQKSTKNKFKGYEKLKNNSFLKYERKGNGTTTTEVGGAIFIKVLFLAESDTVFIDVNKASNTESYPLRIDSMVYEGDFLDILGRLHVGDSVKFFMSLDSLNKYYPEEFVFGDPWDKMKHVGMAVAVDSIFSAKEVEKSRAALALKRQADSLQLVRNDSMHLHTYLADHGFNDVPDANGIWFRKVKKTYGDTITFGDSVTVKYKCMYPDGQIVVEKLQFAFRFGSVEMMPGWNIGLSMMRAGEEALLIVPSDLGYHDGHTLIFEIKIWEIEH
jgi:FKBP-type peptidyl-prolyl cis-trans isomerase FkpA